MQLRGRCQLHHPVLFLCRCGRSSGLSYASVIAFCLAFNIQPLCPSTPACPLPASCPVANPIPEKWLRRIEKDEEEIAAAQRMKALGGGLPKQRKKKRTTRGGSV